MPTSPGGQVVLDSWGSLRYAANTAFVALRLLPTGSPTPPARRATTTSRVPQINYIARRQPAPPQLHDRLRHQPAAQPAPPHRARLVDRPAHRPGREPAHPLRRAGRRARAAERHLHRRPHRLRDERGRHRLQRRPHRRPGPACTREYGGTPLANFPAAETPDGTEMYVESAVNAPGTNFTEIKALVYNKSAWPARTLTNGSFRYYFTLDGGATAAPDLADHRLQPVSRARPGRPSSRGSIYYVTVSCAGQKIAPAGQSDVAARDPVPHHLPDRRTWDTTNDWSLPADRRRRTPTSPSTTAAAPRSGATPPGTGRPTPPPPTTPGHPDRVGTSRRPSATADLDRVHRQRSAVAGRLRRRQRVQRGRRHRRRPTRWRSPASPPATAYTLGSWPATRPATLSAASPAVTFTTSPAPDTTAADDPGHAGRVGRHRHRGDPHLDRLHRRRRPGWPATTSSTRRTPVVASSHRPLALTGLTAATPYVLRAAPATAPATCPASTPVTFTTLAATDTTVADHAGHADRGQHHLDRRHADLDRLHRLRWHRAGRLQRLP